MRETGVVSFQLGFTPGEVSLAQPYLGIARTQLGIAKNLMNLGGLQQTSRTVTLTDGTLIRSQSVMGQDIVTILPIAVQVERERERERERESVFVHAQLPQEKIIHRRRWARGTDLLVKLPKTHAKLLWHYLSVHVWHDGTRLLVARRVTDMPRVLVEKDIEILVIFTGTHEGFLTDTITYGDVYHARVEGVDVFTWEYRTVIATGQLNYYLYGYDAYLTSREARDMVVTLHGHGDEYETYYEIQFDLYEKWEYAIATDGSSVRTQRRYASHIYHPPTYDVFEYVKGKSWRRGAWGSLGAMTYEQILALHMPTPGVRHESYMVGPLVEAMISRGMTIDLEAAGITVFKEKTLAEHISQMYGRDAEDNEDVSFAFDPTSGHLWIYDY